MFCVKYCAFAGKSIGFIKWAEKILNADLTRNNDSYDLMTGAGFNIDIECKKLKDLYQMMIGA